MHRSLILTLSAALLLSSRAAPTSNSAEDNPTAEASTSVHPPPVTQGSSDIEGMIKGLAIKDHRTAPADGPEFNNVPQREPKQSKQDYKRFLNRAHPYVVTEDHGNYVQGHILTSTPKDKLEYLPNTSDHYGIESGASLSSSHIQKDPVYAKNDPEVLKKRPVGVTTERLTEENLKKLKEDVCKRGLGGSCSFRGAKRVANGRLSQVRLPTKSTKTGRKAVSGKSASRLKALPKKIPGRKAPSAKPVKIVQRKGSPASTRKPAMRKATGKIAGPKAASVKQAKVPQRKGAQSRGKPTTRKTMGVSKPIVKAQRPSGKQGARIARGGRK